MGDYHSIYFIQLNALCILLLVIVLFRLRNKRETLSARRRVFLRLTWAAITLCVSDIISGLSNLQTFPGAQFMNEFGNIVDYLGITWIGYIWMVFVNMRLNGLEYNHKRMEVLLSRGNYGNTAQFVSTLNGASCLYPAFRRKAGYKHEF